MDLIPEQMAQFQEEGWLFLSVPSRRRAGRPAQSEGLSRRMPQAAE